MKQLLLMAIFGLLVVPLFAKTIYFVKQSASGTGDSWTNATGDIIAVLFAAEAGDEIWVAAGHYFPTTDNNRHKSFIVPSGVKMYGGFNGSETSPQQRDFQKNKSVLSGNIGSALDTRDNSFTVVYLKDTNANTLIDGFVIADGTADGTGPTADRNRCGAGLYVDAMQGRAEPSIQNCTFQNNYARDGGAAYLNGRSGTCNPIFIGCQFLSNKADLDGGAVFNDGRHGGNASPSFSDCTFNGNMGNYGGAICNYGGRGESSPKVQNCVFRNNEAFLRGGAIFNMDVEGITRPILNGCQFVNNKAVTGNGMYTFSQPNDNGEGVNTPAKLKMN